MEGTSDASAVDDAVDQGGPSRALHCTPVSPLVSIEVNVTTGGDEDAVARTQGVEEEVTGENITMPGIEECSLWRPQRPGSRPSRLIDVLSAYLPLGLLTLPPAGRRGSSWPWAVSTSPWESSGDRSNALFLGTDTD